MQSTRNIDTYNGSIHVPNRHPVRADSQLGADLEDSCKLSAGKLTIKARGTNLSDAT